MDIVLENNGYVAVVRGSYSPLRPGQGSVFTNEIGMLWIINRDDFNLSRETFLSEYPVGAQLNITSQSVDREG